MLVPKKYIIAAAVGAVVGIAAYKTYEKNKEQILGSLDALKKRCPLKKCNK